MGKFQFRSASANQENLEKMNWINAILVFENFGTHVALPFVD